MQRNIGDKEAMTPLLRSFFFAESLLFNAFLLESRFILCSSLARSLAPSPPAGVLHHRRDNGNLWQMELF